MEEEDDDIYDPEENYPANSAQTAADTANNGTATLESAATVKEERMDDDLEEGEEEEEEGEESDSDIDIITDRKDGSRPEPPQQPSRYGTIKSTPARATSSEPPTKAAAVKGQVSGKGSPPRSGADYPAVATSTIDVDAKPIFEPVGKPITEVDLDNDFGENEKPWRRPGTDMSDYFNYGFDEFTWASYCLKQNSLRKEVQDQKKQLEDMMMLGMGGSMPGMAMPGVPPGMGLPPMPGMPDMTPEVMQQMMQFMPQANQMDPSMFLQQMGQDMSGQNGGNTAAQGTGFGGANTAYNAQGQNQQAMGYGFDPAMMNGGDRNRGAFAARGRGGNRRNW